MSGIRDLAAEVRANREEVRANREEVQNVLQPMARALFGFRPTSSATFDPTWETRLSEYYNTTSCMILGQLFPECLKPDRYHGFGPDYFEPVGEHMYKKVQELAGYELGIDTTHPRNGLLIVNSLEKMFQEAHMVLVPTVSEEDVSETDCPDSGDSPTEQVKLEILIAKEFLGQDVLWIDKRRHTTAPFQRPILQGKGGSIKGPRPVQPIKFADLHEKQITIRKPYMASLYMQAIYANHRHSELPHPDDQELLPKYRKRCPKGMERLMIRMCLLSSCSERPVLTQDEAFSGNL